MTQEVEIKVDNGVQIIRLLRADKKNALTGPMYDAMSAALDSAEKATPSPPTCSSARAACSAPATTSTIRTPRERWLAGRGALAEIHPAAAQGDPAHDRRRRRVGRRHRRNAAAALRLVYATPTASFRTPFVDLGLIQEAGSSVLGPARIGHARAFELFGLGEPWTAARAAEAGLVNAVVPAGELEAKALAAARRLAAKPRAAMLAARRMLKGEPALTSKAIADEVAVYKD